jgi:uncharacterized protein YabN with tetrapyrrole methylase and pyrophosphatase domain
MAAQISSKLKRPSSCAICDAISREDFDDLRGELGDLLFQVVFYAQMAQEEGRWRRRYRQS